MRFHVLGPIEVEGSDGGAPAPGSRQRALLSVLLAKVNEVVSRDRLVDVVWEGEVTESTHHTLAVHISNLRKRLRPVSGPDDGVSVLETAGEGYRLRLESDQLDAFEFEKLADRGQGLLASGDPSTAALTLKRALELWRGPAFGDSADLAFVHDEAIRLDEFRLAAIEARVEARLALGHHGQLVAELESLVAEHPLRETYWGQLMLSLYRCGRHAESLSAYRRYSDHLAELGLEPSPYLRRLEDRILIDDPDLAPTPPVRPKTSRSPPAERNRLIGRDIELRQLSTRLSETRLLTLTGTGGVGKTRMAQRLAWSLIDEEVPVWWVDLAGLTDPERLLETVAAAGDIPQSAHADLTDSVIRVLAEPPPKVIVLDTVEHLVSSTARLVDQLLDRVATLRFLITSREPLQVGGETVWRVASLSLPELEATASDVLASTAVQLFVDRAASRGTEANTGDLAAVADICRRLDGIPLAIELAAARTPTLTPQAIADRLNDRFSLLGGAQRAALPRHRTLEAVIDWSFRLLEETDRRLLSRLAVFRGPFDLEAATAVGGFEPLPERNVEEAITRLADQSMIEVVSSDGLPQFRMMESVQSFAWDRLADDPDLVLRRHRDWARQFAERGERGAIQNAGTWIHRVTSSIDDFRAAWQWSMDVGEVEQAMMMAAALQWPLCVSGRSREAENWIAEAKSHIDSGSLPAKSRARVALVYGVSRLVRCDLGAARASEEEAAQLYRDLEHIPGQYWTEFWLILIDLAGRRLPTIEAIENLDSLARAWGDKSAICRADWLRLRYDVLDELAAWPDTDPDALSASSKRAAALAQEATDAGFADLAADARAEQAILLAAAQDADWLSVAEQAANEVRRIGAGHQYAGVLLKIAEAAVLMGAFKQAKTWLEAATDIARVMDEPWPHTTALRIGAEAAGLQGRAQLQSTLLRAAGESATSPHGIVLGFESPAGDSPQDIRPVDALWEAFAPAEPTARS